jgi:tRNA(Ile2) C34 agmatinyltransferase TiaS
VLAAYAGNELKGDQLYKGKTVRLTGKVDDVKNDILNHPFVTLGTGKQFEIPQIQCSLAESEAGKAANLSKGQDITVVGEVKGLMMNVQVDECMIQ